MEGLVANKIVFETMKQRFDHILYVRHFEQANFSGVSPLPMGNAFQPEQPPSKNSNAMTLFECVISDVHPTC